MKRFFQPVKRDELPSKKQAQPDTVLQPDDGKPVQEPTKFMSWNANSFLLRLKNSREEFFNLIKRLDPDVIAIQEVRIPAAGRKGEKKNQSEMKDDTSSARDDKQTIMRALSVSPLVDYQVWWSLADNKYGGTALLVKRQMKPIAVKYCFDDVSETGLLKHEPDGRVIIADFQSFQLLNTYAPNNGWKDDEMGFERRRKWDKRVLRFVTQTSSKPLIWCGDLNVSHEDIDVTHPEFFATAKLAGYTPSEMDIGQPGFTRGERERFAEIMTRGNLVDTYRCLQREQDFDSGFTWSGNPVGKYRGKRMRIDYFLISRSLVSRLVSSKIHGHGIEMEGYYGSDHCPITLELSPSSLS